MIDKDSSGFHIELFKNENAIISALRKEGLAFPEIHEPVKKVSEELARNTNARILVEATVRQHARRSKKGKVSQVKQHERKIAGVMVIGATPAEATTIERILSRHDEKVVASVPSITVFDTKRFGAMMNTTYRQSGGDDRLSTKGVAAWYDERTSRIFVHRSVIKSMGWRQVLDHELGHAAYFHSPKSILWDDIIDRDWEKWEKKGNVHKKFDQFTLYSQENSQEAFAESYMAYMAVGGKAKNLRYRKVFDVVNKVIKTVKPKSNYWRRPN